MCVRAKTGTCDILMILVVEKSLFTWLLDGVPTKSVSRFSYLETMIIIHVLDHT